MPVFLLYMANMGDILAKSLKWVYAKVCICKKLETQYDPSVVWRSADAILRSTALPTTIIPPRVEDDLQEVPRPAHLYHPQHRYGLYSRDHYLESDEDDEDDDDLTDREIPTVSGRLSRQRGYYDPRRDYGPRTREKDFPREMLYETEEELSIESGSIAESRSGKVDISAVNIPITVSLVIMTALLYGGTKMFEAYEDWDGLTSFYFCFISLTTIGFGDYVPGDSVTSSMGGTTNFRFIYCSVYLMFGLALLSMCFNLMQEEVVHKFTTCLKSFTFSRKKDVE